MEPVSLGDDELRAAKNTCCSGDPTPHHQTPTGVRLTVREFRPEDGDAIRYICKRHFRSLCYPAVRYYCIEHFRDLIALLVVGSLFVTWTQMLFQVLLFVAYLFVRARVELELYIYRSCPDLLDIPAHYMQGPSNRRSNFWVAEMERESQDAKKVERKVVGCVGCRPARDDPSIAQLLRLVVAEDSRRMRFGSRLLAQFELFAREIGFREVRLYTNNLSTHHIRFIGNHGYVVVHCISRALMRGALIQWRKSLTPEEGGTPKATLASSSQELGRVMPVRLPETASEKAKLIAGMTISSSCNNLAALSRE